MPKKSGQFVFKKTDNIGSMRAEEDSFLKECYIKNDYSDEFFDMHNYRSIIIGRTGVGKTALLMQFLNNENINSFELEIDSSCLHQLATTNIVQQLQNYQIEWLPLCKLLWKHIIFGGIVNKISKRNTSLWGRIESFFTNKNLSDLISTHNQDFFSFDTITQIKQLTQILDSKCSASIGVPLTNASYSLNSIKTNSNTEDIKTKLQSFISSEISTEFKIIFEVLNSILDNKQKPLYVTIDRLEELYINEEVEALFLRALIEVVIDFNYKVENLKILIGFRQDLFDSIWNSQYCKSLQREKFNTNIRVLTWDKEELRDFLTKRINKLLKDKYTNAPLTIDDIFTKHVSVNNKHINTFDYLTNLTWLRPRDLIELLNMIIPKNVNKNSISQESIRSVEAEYSKSRKDALISEWYKPYPAVEECINLLDHFPTYSTYTYFEKKFHAFIENLYGNAAYSKLDLFGTIEEIDAYLFKGNMSLPKKYLIVLYEIGAIGIKTNSTNPFYWKHINSAIIMENDIEDNSKIQIHPALIRSLNCLTPNNNYE